MSESFEEQLRALRADVSKLLERMDGPPKAMSYEKAARLLDVSPRMVFELVAKGQLVPVRIGGRKKIPLSEIERLTTPRETPLMPKVAHGRKRHDGAKEAERALSLANLRKPRR